MSREYLDFELQIEQTTTAGQYHVSVVASPAGETERPLQIPFPFTASEMEGLYREVENALLRSRVRTRKTLTPEEQVVHRFGQQLFEAVFQGDVRSLFYESKNKAQERQKGMRLKLRLRPPEFAQLPWEFLWEPRRKDYICLSQDTPLVRYLEQPQPVRPLTVTPPLRILGMVSSPYNLPDLDVAAEKERIERALAAAQQRGAEISIQWLEGETASDLQRALRRAAHAPYHIFHFIGHGEFDAGLGEGVLWLADERGGGGR